MFARIFLAFVFLFPFALQPDSKIHLDVKLGLWETTTTSTMTGLPTIPDSALAQMPADQRARMEAMIKERMGKPTTTKSCLTKEKLENEEEFRNARKTCTYTVITSTSSKVVVKMECTQNNMKMTGDFVVEALDPGNVKGSVHMNTSDGNGATNMNMNSTFTSKWLGTACGDVQ